MAIQNINDSAYGPRQRQSNNPSVADGAKLLYATKDGQVNVYTKGQFSATPEKVLSMRTAKSLYKKATGMTKLTWHNKYGGFRNTEVVEFGNVTDTKTGEIQTYVFLQGVRRMVNPQIAAAFAASQAAVEATADKAVVATPELAEELPFA